MPTAYEGAINRYTEDRIRPHSMRRYTHENAGSPTPRFLHPLAPRSDAPPLMIGFRGYPEAEAPWMGQSACAPPRVRTNSPFREPVGERCWTSA